MYFLNTLLKWKMSEKPNLSAASRTDIPSNVRASSAILTRMLVTNRLTDFPVDLTVGLLSYPG